MKLYKIVEEILMEASIKSVMPSSNISDEEKEESYKKLSDGERSQLNQSGYVPYELWPTFRNLLLKRSQASNSSLNTELTAYTPGETLHLLNHPIIKSWHNNVVSYNIDDVYKKVIFVPCAKTKPWENASRGIYKDYNKLRVEHPNWFFVTISEPLGIVPQSMWGNFPQYDNPGLFRDTVQRSGLFTRDFKRLFNTDTQLKVPFDESAYNTCIDVLATVIKKFLDTNSDKDFTSYVEDFEGVGAHSDMLTRAGFSGRRFTKRSEPRQGPYAHINKTVN